jgi:Conserved protein/domain typically associated with flavoprotein oxygenases, DIM6/NTAB family
MQKIPVSANSFPFPMPITLLGANVQGRANFMALGWVTRVNASPPMIGCGVGKHHLTPQGIRENQTFSINVPNAPMIEKGGLLRAVLGKTGGQILPL